MLFVKLGKVTNVNLHPVLVKIVMALQLVPTRGRCSLIRIAACDLSILHAPVAKTVVTVLECLEELLELLGGCSPT